MTPALYLTIFIDDDADVGRHALDTYTRATYGLSLDTLETIQLLLTGPRQFVQDRLLEYVNAGARHIVCRLGAPSLAAQAEQLEHIAQLLPSSPAGTDDADPTGAVNVR